jgi:hypothetical protein
VGVVTPLYQLRTETYGTIRVEEWPEGLVIWVGGEIRWRSFACPHCKDYIGHCPYCHRKLDKKSVSAIVDVVTPQSESKIDVLCGRVCDLCGAPNSQDGCPYLMRRRDVDPPNECLLWLYGLSKVSP